MLERAALQKTFVLPLGMSWQKKHNKQDRNGVYGQFITHCLLLFPPEGEDSSHSSSSPVWGPSNRKQSSMNFSNVSTSHGLQFFRNCSTWEPLMWFSPSGTDCIGPHRVTGPASKPAPARAPLRGTIQPARSLVKHRVTASFGYIHLLRCGVLRGLHVDICSIMDVYGLLGLLVL
ncbi:uncharacterized protein LOC120754546 isoform X2 [Hirundo rustica]|uniref:uncharacterized protein LOC120754546 isoform X2 n=1 Tax=Hirundo rustica TaxID=43150 RepID=UPI001A93F947|nr:uncharacterized protein LOC120754546 isoform X2 [Hirundo rustica]